MKICYIADASSIHTYRWVMYFANKGHAVSIISFDPPLFEYGKVKIFSIVKLRKSPGTFSQVINFFPILFQLWWIKKKLKIDLFHALGSSKGWFASLLNLRPLIFTIADPGIFSIPFQRKLPLIYKILNKYAFRKSDLFVCDGENTRKALIEFGVSEEKIKIIRYGVDTEKFKVTSPSKELRKSFFQENNRIIISTKPLRSECDVETLIRAAPAVLKEVPEAKFLILGEGDQKEKLRELSRTLDFDNRVVFTGQILYDDMPCYFQMADVYVCTSLVETGLAASTAEAMACGLPVVVSDSGDNAKWIRNGENGFVFPLKDSQALAEGIISLLKNEEQRKKFAKANRKLIEKHNNYSIEMERMERIYKEFKKKK